MARTKTPIKAPTRPLSSAPSRTLTTTDLPGVFRNRAGVLVDAKGIAVNFKTVKKVDDSRFEEVLGRPATTPLDVMEGVALDPRNPMPVRMDAAKAAAPYRHAKRIAIQGVDGAPPINMNYEAKSPEELASIRSRLEELAALMGTKK